MSTDTHAAAIPASSGLKQPYHLVDPSPWPIFGALGGGLTVLGIVFVAHYHNWALLILGLAAVLAVMFFVAFFWAFFNFALFPEHVAFAKVMMWPPEGIRTFDPFHIPFLNTMILLLSGTTVTWAHHSLLENDRKGLVVGMALTVLLGLSFTGFQALEYSQKLKKKK